MLYAKCVFKHKMVKPLLANNNFNSIMNESQVK